MRYAIIDNGVVVNIAECDSSEFANEQGWVACTDRTGIGWSFDGNAFIEPPIEKIDLITNEMKILRSERDLLLAATDWAQAVDVPQAIKDKYATYRQALRDVPQQSGFPQNIVWPVKPE